MHEHGRAEEIKDAHHAADISAIESEADAAEARQAIDTFKSWKDAKTDAKRAEMELDEDMTDRKHGRDMEYLKSVTETGGADVASTIVQGRELSGMSPEQLEALAKMKEAEARAKEDKVQFMMDVEDRERADANRRKELDADLMSAAKPITAGFTLKKCSSCRSTIPAKDIFCGQCGSNKNLYKQQIDFVHFSVTAPLTMEHKKLYVLNVWAYLKEQEEDFIKQAKESQNSEYIRTQSKNNVKVERGTSLIAHLSIPDLIVKDPGDTIIWDGKLANASFPINVPRDACIGSHLGKVTLYANGILISKIHFTVEIGVKELPSDQLKLNEQRIQSAFVSYANKDRNKVLSRIQGMRLIAPEMDVFMDVISICSGDKWKNILISEIKNRDVFYLFWSLAASRSDYVEMEWRTALEMRGIDYISPVPLVSPEEVPPPKDLAELHFNDWVLGYMRGNGIG